MRDERCVLNDAVVLGITRRALLEAGKRLVARGRLEDAEHAVDLRPEEVTSLLRGKDTTAPSREELAEYARYRTTKTYLDAPEHLGIPPSAPPPPEWLPLAAARIQRATMAVLGAMFDTRAKLAKGETREGVVKGLAVGGGSYEGTARLVLSSIDFPRVAKGDVLVARATGPTYNALLPLLGALVTDRGGLLSHPAIIAREYGLPGVVGCVDATTRIADGARVRVDGVAGEVHLL
jgi:pyruvate,water dikinase